MPESGHYSYNTERCLDALDISADATHLMLEGDMRRVFLSFDAELKARAL